MTIITQASNRGRSTGPFFAIMAVVIALTVVAGFSLNMKIRRLDFGALPWLVHVHAAVFVGWLVFFVV